MVCTIIFFVSTFFSYKLINITRNTRMGWRRFAKQKYSFVNVQFVTLFCRLQSELMTLMVKSIRQF